MPEELTTKQFIDMETGKPISNPVYIGDVYDKDGADAVLRLFGQDKTRDTCGRVGDYRITDDPVLAENHLWPDGSPIDPVAWPELHAYAARLGWQTDAAGRFLLPDLRGKYLVGADSRDPDFAAGKESGEKAHTLTKAELPNVSIGLGAAVIKSDTEAIRVTDSGPLWYRMGRSVQETAGPLGNGEPHNNLPPYRAVYILLRAKPDPVVAQEVAADRLATARKIGSASFDGSADITLAQMGAATVAQGEKADSAMPKTGGIFSGPIIASGITSKTAMAVNEQLFLSTLTQNYGIKAEAASGYTMVWGMAGAKITDMNGMLKPLLASNISGSSSRRYKHRIRDMDEDTAKRLLQLRPVGFEYKKELNDPGPKYGLVAEELAEIDSTCVYKDGNGQAEGINYTMLVPQLIKLCQIQQAQIDALAAHLAALEAL